MAEHPEFPPAAGQRRIGITRVCVPVSRRARAHRGGCVTADWVVAQVSDPHLTSPGQVDWRTLGAKRLLSYLSWRRKRRYRHRPEILAAVMADLRASRPDHLLVTGDLTHLGLPAECVQAERWLAGLGDPRHVSVIPGNHDLLVEDDWSATAGLWKAGFESDQESWPAGARHEVVRAADREAAFPSLRRRGGVALIGLNTAVPTPALFASGRLGDIQLIRLRSMLAELGRERLFRLVYLHHSPLPDGHAWRKRLRDAAALLDVLRETGAELVVHGHGHHEAMTTVETAAGPLLIVGAPSASLAGRYTAGWNRYAIRPAAGGWAVGVEQHRYADGKMFRRDSSEHLLPRGGAVAV